MTCHFVRWTSTEVLPSLQRLSDDLIASTQSFSMKRRERYLKSRALLAELMFYLFGYPMLPPLMTAPNGRPCFSDINLPSFSLGYAGNTIGLLLSETGSVGMSMEIVHVRASQQPQSVWQTQAEKAWVDAQIDPLEAASQLAVIRQSVLKIPGFNLDGSKSLKLHPASGRLRVAYLPEVEAMSDIDDYLAWACARTPQLNRLVLWNYTVAGGLSKTSEIIQQQRQSTRFMKLTSRSAEKK
ncbi:4'-phosphopantetheinyl transferase family protein [Lonsdalea quercina]|uniref:Phosphopantetheinyl transferase n=1 Tax=Lonsdalea quercina TaxID=71657 RepID=A0A1H4CFT0_9GAMM|nr:hypothetical protein [Lonsdalea quercina]SEA59183.1 Phosphopantetheinyl transferase [Lonsdalea quercina]